MTIEKIIPSIGEEVIKKVINNEKGWKQIFSGTFKRIGFWDWPNPSLVYRDKELEITYAIDVSEPKLDRENYLKSLGKAVSLLGTHDYVAIVIPKFSVDNFGISQYISEKVELLELPISIVEYNEELLFNDLPNSLKIIRGIKEVRNKKVSKARDTETFWSWWRDASQYEVLDLLKLAQKYKNETGDIYTKYVWPEFSNLMYSGQTKQWDGKPRIKTRGKGESSEKQNYKIPMSQLGLWSQENGRITKKGQRLLEIGQYYGANSEQFIDYLTYIVLTDGKHNDLIREIEEFQILKQGDLPDNSSDYRIELESYLNDRGAIGQRKPTAVTTGNKGSYLRDEMKLWVKLDLLITNNGKYFEKGKGYIFNWNRIKKVLNLFNQSTEKNITDSMEAKESTFNYDDDVVSPNNIPNEIPKNLIIYGAPGTGKSFQLNEDVKGYFPNDWLFSRVTFHSNYSYSQFIGTYRPTPIYQESSKKIYETNMIVETKHQREPLIDYRFEAGPLISTVCKALLNPNHNFLVLIEEINRTDSLSVFGDFMQLLDRGQDGESEYSITPNKDILNYLLAKGVILKGNKLRFPKNLYLWATMNSADQGVFPIDTAFKRRWVFKYFPLNQYESVVSKIEIKLSFLNKPIKWNSFRKIINDKLEKIGVVEDKLIGPFFMKKEEIESLNTDAFQNKLLMYLRDDVVRHNPQLLFKKNSFSSILRDYDEGENIFNIEKGLFIEEMIKYED